MADPPKRGRPRSFPVHEVTQELLNCKEEIIVDGYVAGKRQPIWQDMSSALNEKSDGKIKLSAAYLYVCVKGNRFNLLDFLQETPQEGLKRVGSLNVDEGLKPAESESDKGSSESNDALSSTTVHSSEGEQIDSGKDAIQFQIKLSHSEWNTIKPEKVAYKDKRGSGGQRTYLTLKRSTWTHVINAKFWSKTKLRCKLSYHGGKVATSDIVHDITINGRCCHCKAKLHAYVEKIPEEGEHVVFNCSYKGNFSIEHPKGLKRNLAGVVREKAVGKLLNENVAPLAFQQRQADTFMLFEDDEPPHLPTTKQLRDAKSNAAKRLRVDLNPIVAIAKAMHSSRFKNIIRDVSYDKFQVRYHSSAQLHIYKNFCKKKYPVSVALDATGGVVKKIQRAPGVKSGHIFLYNLVIRDPDSKKIYPVCSLLSERHDTETLRHWLANFIRCSVPIPNEVVTDMSSALMSASVQAFTSFPSLEEYINRCAQLLKLTDNSSDSRLPECYVRNDVAHLVKLMTTWDCFKNCIKITKQFYVRCLCQVLQSTQLDDITTLLNQIMTVAISKTEGEDDMGQPTPCETSKQSLVKRIGGLLTPSIDVTISNEDAEEEDDHEELNNRLLTNVKISQQKRKTKHDTNPFYIMVNNIRISIETQLVDGDRGNQQYLPGLIKHLLGISSLIPLWTGVMVPLFGFGGITASSAAVEADFNILKNVLFKNKSLPLRVDDFVFHHIPATEGAMKIAAAKDTDDFVLLSDDEHYSDITESSTKESSDLRLQSRIHEAKHKEDWGGLIQTQLTTRHRRHQSYLQPNPELTLSDLTKSRPRVPIGLIKNGNRESLQPVKLSSGMKVTLSNTCAYDSILQLFAVAFCDSVIFQKSVEQSSNPFLLSVKDFVLKGVTRKIYVDRAQILQPVTPFVKLPQDVYLFKCETPITALVPTLLSSEPSVFEISTCDQDNCSNKESTTNRVPVSVTINVGEIEKLEHSITTNTQDKRTICFQTLNSGGYCQGSRVLKKETNEYLLIEPVEDSASRLMQCRLKVRDIPNKIVVKQKEYFLRGCVGFIGSDNTNEIGHYVAYALRCDGCWETFNDLKEKKDDHATKEDIKCHLILYTV